MANSRKYAIEFKTESTDAVPAALQGTKYWYDTGTTENDEAVYYDNLTGLYAYWNDGTDWIVSAVADVGGTPTDYFDLDGQGDWTGTITIGTNVIADAWYRAETTAFDSLKAFTGSVEGVDCFRGFLPVQGDDTDDLLVNLWSFTSGGSDFDIQRLYGSDALWCSMQANARIESLWETRQKAMEFAGLVQAWIKETGNLGQTEAVEWLTLSDLPPEPEIDRTSGINRQRIWRQTIELELTYKTETVFSS